MRGIPVFLTISAIVSPLVAQMGCVLELVWVAEELRVADPGCLADYAQREPTHRERFCDAMRA